MVVLDIPTWTAIVNSNFTTSLVGALAGAFAGAYGAQRVADRSKLRQDLQTEIRNTNAAIALAFGIANSALSCKKQHFLPMRDKYQKEQTRYKEWITKRRIGAIQGNARFEIRADLVLFPDLCPPIEPLQELVFSKITSTSRVINLTSTLNE